VVFGRPQYLVFREWHSTTNGRMDDNEYMLFTSAPDADGHFPVPDGSGGVFHSWGRLVGGPYADDGALCPQMIALGIDSLEAWPPGSYAPFVTCARFRGPGSGSATGPGGGQPAPPPVPPAALAAVGVVLAGTGLVTLRRPRPPAVPPAGHGAPPDREEQPDRGQHAKPADPCEAQAVDYDLASARSRALQQALQLNRAVEALMEREIVRLANVVIPSSFGFDVAFLVGGIGGRLAELSGASRYLAASTIRQKIAEGFAKDVLKAFGKQVAEGLGGVKLADLATKGGEGGLKAILKEAITRSLTNNEMHGVTSLHPPLVTVESPYSARYAELANRLQRYGDDVAKPIADGVGHLLSIYNAGMGVLTLREQLEILRLKRSAIADQTADLEVELESALEAQRFARERLDHCRLVNAPGWRP
jgi:hypothetical protein